MAYWFAVRKTTISVHVEYGYTTGTVFTDDIRVRGDDPFDISVDLTKSLRTRTKSVGTYLDARDLGEELDSLTSLQIDDEHALKGIVSRLTHLAKPPQTYRLLVTVGDARQWYIVQPEPRGQGAHESLILRVRSVATVSE